MDKGRITDLKTKFPHLEIKEDILCPKPGELHGVMAFLKEAGFDFLNDLTAVETKEGFTMIYRIGAYGSPLFVTVKTNLAKETPQVVSLTNLWASADWLEREVYDMFGITFSGHPNLKRILMDEGFDGYPLRKDFAG